MSSVDSEQEQCQVRWGEERVENTEIKARQIMATHKLGTTEAYDN